MADQRYQKAVVIGNGKLALDCALAVKQYVPDVTVIEYKMSMSSSLEKHCGKTALLYENFDKDELTCYLMDINVPTLVISAGSTYIVPKAVLFKSELFIINWHNALLPKHKGRFAESWAIYSGDEKTGITWHILTKEIDAGDILIQKEIPLDGSETALSLFKKQCTLGVEALKEILEDIMNGRVNAVSQSGEGEMHLAKDIPADGVLDMSLTFDRISAFLRAMDHGALYLLGKPAVIIDGEKYHFGKYSFSEEKCATGFNNTDYCFESEGHFVTLKHMEKDDI